MARAWGGGGREGEEVQDVGLKKKKKKKSAGGKEFRTRNEVVRQRTMRIDAPAWNSEEEDSAEEGREERVLEGDFPL